MCGILFHTSTNNMQKTNFRLLGVQFSFQILHVLVFSYQILSTFRDLPFLFQKVVLPYAWMASLPSPGCSQCPQEHVPFKLTLIFNKALTKNVDSLTSQMYIQSHLNTRSFTELFAKLEKSLL